MSKEWFRCYKSDPKRLWKMIDWKGDITRKDIVPPNIITSYFDKIFNSNKTVNNPKIQDIEKKINEYNSPCSITDLAIDMDDINFALKKIGKGISLDGLSSELLLLIPENLKNCVLALFRNVFSGFYPDQWKKQLLIPVTKKGHSLDDPKLRGVAIGPLLGRLFDIILDKKFRHWYSPNPEQAGFRQGQGCIIQLFAFFLLMDKCKLLNKTLFIGLLDYEKAFDFVNRPTLLKG